MGTVDVLPRRAFRKLDQIQHEESKQVFCRRLEQVTNEGYREAICSAFRAFSCPKECLMDTILTEEFDIFRKVVAFSTSDSWKRVPHVAYLYKPDVTDFFDFYKERCRMVAVRPGERKKVTLAHYF